MCVCLFLSARARARARVCVCVRERERERDREREREDACADAAKVCGCVCVRVCFYGPGVDGKCMSALCQYEYIRSWCESEGCTGTWYKSECMSARFWCMSE